VGSTVSQMTLDEDEDKILLGECKLKWSKFTPYHRYDAGFTKAEVQRLKEKTEYVKWKIGKRKEYFALFSMETIPEVHRKSLEKDRISALNIKELLGR